VVHAAGVIHPATVADFDRVNTKGTAAVVDAARRAGVRRLVQVSSNSPFGFNATPTDVFRHGEPYDPWLGYGRSKMRGERLVLDAHLAGDLEATVVRPPWFYGPFQPERQTLFFKLVRRGRFPVVGTGEQRRSMAFVDNLVQGVALAERVPAAAGHAFWVADERPYPLTEIVSTVKQALAAAGLDVARGQVRLPALAGRFAQQVDTRLQARGRYHQQFHVLGEMGESIACDVTRTCEVLGYQPEVALLEGMLRSVRWCLAQGYEI
jgi:nucleoside-diphosphate-sugar epimerase